MLFGINKNKFTFLLILIISISLTACAQNDKAELEKSQQHQEKSNELRLQGNLEAAITEQLKAVELTPNDSQAQRVLGSLYKQTAREKNKPEYLPKSKETLEKAIQIEPNNPLGHSMLADVLTQTNDSQGAVREQKEAVRLDPNNTRYYTNLGTYYGLLEDKRLEREQYEKALKIDGDYAPAIYNLALLEKEEGNFAKALELLKRTLELETESKETIKRAKEEIKEIKSLMVQIKKN